MAVALAGRTLDGVELPGAGTWKIDPSHSSVEFTARHLMVAKVRGRFGEFSGAVHVAEVPEESSVEVTIDASSIDTREDRRDAHLRSQDFFDVDNHPAITFRGAGLRRTGDMRFELPGELTIRGVARPVTLQVDYGGLTLDPWGNSRAAFSAKTEIDREGFGLTWNQALETGGVLVGKQVKIEIEIEAVRAAD